MSMKNHNPEEHDASGGELFIVDNSVSGWTVLRYLQEWCELAKSFDIATGFFEIGSLLALDTKWQLLEKIRILMGSETTHRTRALFLEAVRARALDALDSSIEAVKEGNPFLTGVDAIRAALESKKIECRIYDKGKFHAKTYITHATDLPPLNEATSGARIPGGRNQGRVRDAKRETGASGADHSQAP